MTSSSRDAAAPNKPAVDYEALIERLPDILCNDAAARTIAGATNAPLFAESSAEVQAYWRAIAGAVINATAIRDLLARVEDWRGVLETIAARPMHEGGCYYNNRLSISEAKRALARHLTQGETDVA